MIGRPVLCLLALTPLALPGCRSLDALGEDLGERRRPVCLLALLDDSSSYQHRQEATDVVILPLLDALEPGDQMVVRAISDRSMSSDDIINVTLPASEHSFDTVELRRCQDLRSEARAALLSFACRSGKSPATDLLGALLAVSTVKPPGGARRILLILSDLCDTNVGALDLEGVDLTDTQVIAAFVEMDGTRREYLARDGEWKDLFRDAGATSPAILSPSASRSLEPKALLSGE